jgi:hypothetical protein
VSTDARYLFAVARGLDQGDLSGASGLGGAALDVVRHRGLDAVVCDVDLEEYGEGALRRNLEDLAWVERVARTHDDVVRRVAAVATTAPLRLVTILSDDDSVRRHVDELHAELVGALDRVEGCSEWSVKAYVRAQPREEVAAAARPQSGADYLRAKQQDARVRREAREDAVMTARRIHAAFAAQAVAGRRLALQDPQLSGRQEAMLLNDAFLVADVEAGPFALVAQEVRGHHPEVEVVLQGPWPPYSFAVLS